MKLLLVVPYLLLLLSTPAAKGNRVNYESRDLTWVSGAKGRDVVEATIQKIKAFAGVQQDFSMLKRYALIESTWGNDEEIMNSHPDGGIWQIQSDTHNLSSQLQPGTPAAELVERMEEVFNVKCLFCEMNYSTPMVSGLAAQAFNQFRYGPNAPGNVTLQSTSWVDVYHPGGNATNYTAIVNSFNQREDKFCDEDFKLDLWILLDDSEDISDEEFEDQLNFISALASKFSVSNSEAQIGFSVLSNNEHEIHFWFNESSSLSAVKSVVAETKRNEPNLQTDEGLKDIVNNRFSLSNGGRSTTDKDLRRIIVVITDDTISGNVETASEDVESSNASVIVLASCSSCNETKLNSIATDPDDAHVTTFININALTTNESKNEAHKQICKTVFAHSVYSYIESSLIESSSSYSDVQSLITDVKNNFNLDCFDCEDASSSAVENTLSDIFDAGKVISEENSKKLKRELITWSSEHHDEDCPADVKIDLWFLGNGKLNKYDAEFSKVTTFVADIVSDFTISPTKVQVGLSISHSNRYDLYFNLNQHSNSDDLDVAIRNIDTPTNPRKTGNALLEIMEQGFTDDAGARPLTSFVPRTIFLITNGKFHENITSAGDELYKANISVYGVGMGNDVNTTQMDEMLSQPLRKHSYHLYEFNKLEVYLIPEVYTSFCRSPIPVTAINEIELVLKPNVERYLWTKVFEEKDLKISFAISEEGSSGKAYVSVAVTEPNDVYHDVSINLRKGTTNILVKVSELVAKHRGRIQDIEKWIVRDGIIAVYMTLVSTGSTMNLITSVQPLEQGSVIPVNEGDDEASDATTGSSQSNGDSSNNSQIGSSTTATENGNSDSEQSSSNGAGSYGTDSDDTGSDGTGSDGTGSNEIGSDETGSDGTRSDGTESDGTGSDGTGSDDTDSNNNGVNNGGATTTTNSNTSNQNGKLDSLITETRKISVTPTSESPLDSNANAQVGGTDPVDGKGLPQNGVSDPIGPEMQTGGSNSAFAALAAIPLVLFIVLLAYYRKKKKKKIDPAQKLAAMEEVKQAMEKAQIAEAEHIDLLALESKIEAATSLQVSGEELVEANETLQTLRGRLSQEKNV